VGSNVVEVYIGYLRHKIDAPFATPLLHTVRGAGYALRAGVSLAARRYRLISATEKRKGCPP